MNNVGACVICIPKLTASPVLRQLSVQKLMKIESRHRSLFDPRPARWKLAHSTLGCSSSHRALIPLMHVDRTCKAAGIARTRKARCNTRHEHQIARSPLWLSDIRRQGCERAKQAMREADPRRRRSMIDPNGRVRPASASIPAIAQCLNGGYGWCRSNAVRGQHSA